MATTYQSLWISVILKTCNYQAGTLGESERHWDTQGTFNNDHFSLYIDRHVQLWKNLSGTGK